MMHDYAVIGTFVLVGAIFVMLAVNVSNVLSHQRPSPEKGRIYECGVDPVGAPWIQFRISYYVYALLFVVFDIETVFLYPWAVVFSRMDVFVLVEMAVFIGILLLGLAYAWKEGALEWR
ncbi:MAG: NADH-quinone oxidoreductase subunit A [Clostridiales bacterium]|nr:NADH-quinone oxidoreductase subunit A [Clostridiales bacterium]